jgi:hypothetical protein
MGFLAPKPPKVPAPAKPPTPASNPIFAKDDVDAGLGAYGPGSLITTSSSGLKRKASTQRTSLIGG